MSGEAVRPSTVNGAPQFLRANPSIAFELPDPSERWSRQDVPREVAERITKLQTHHIIEIAERHGADVEYNAHLYRTTQSAHAFIDRHLERPTTLDCGHSGIRNLGDGEYTCGYDDCDIRVGREAAREVLGR